VSDLGDSNLVGSSVTEVSVYKTGGFTDLCRGPHVQETKEIDPESFRLTRVSGAYWRGNQEREQMQRVYGVAFDTKKELEEYFVRLEEARKRDHRKVGRELGLFMFHPWAPGAAFWLPKGTTLYNTLANYIRGVLFPAGYVEVKAPLIFNKALWETSGHWAHYRQNMFLVESEDEEMGAKAMNCPGHMLIFGSEVRSYRDLPLRFHEQTPLHRNEASGVLSGLTRVRQFSQDDAHCFVTQDQIGDEVERVIRLVQRVYRDFGLSYEAKLSTMPDEHMGDEATWQHAESQLKAALERAGMAFTINEKDGAFYGPKIDFDVTDAIGRKWQCATIQLDYQLPERFDLKYTGADNADHCPIVIHRAIFGSFERFIAILIEHYAGAFPIWLSPVQAMIIPIADRHADYCAQVKERLQAAGLRVDIDSSVERMNAKIRNAQMQKIPYMLVVGDREQEQNAVAVRLRSGEDLKTKPLDEFIALAHEAINNKK
jgi:threonyl-tRNA synthetase